MEIRARYAIARQPILPAILKAAVAIAAILFLCPAASAQNWPSRPVTIVSPFLAGSTPDAVARIIAERLQRKLGQTFVVENRTGASGNTGTAVVAKAAPDGHTLGVSIVGPLVINALLFPQMPYETSRDIAPIMILASQPSVLTLNPTVKADDVSALIAIMKKDADKIAYGSIGRGSLSHLAMESFAAKAGVRLLHVPYAGSPAVVTALLRGDVQVAVLPAGAVVPHAAEGKLKMLAVTSARRSPLLPLLPTLAESGIANVEADAWVGLIAPIGVPADTLVRIRENVAEIMREPELIEKLKLQFMTPVAGTADEFRAVLREEYARWSPVIAAGAIKADQ